MKGFMPTAVVLTKIVTSRSQVAKAVSSVYVEMINLAKEAKALTTAHKIQQDRLDPITK